MARPIDKRYRVRGTLVAETPLHVGAYGPEIATDLPVARNGADRPVIPGTSLAGALRAWHRWACDGSWTDHAPGRVPGRSGFADQLWGFAPDANAPSENGVASAVIVEDAPVTTDTWRKVGGAHSATPTTKLAIVVADPPMLSNPTLRAPST